MSAFRHIRRSDAEGGAAAVEFALVWSVLALFLIGIIQFGVLFDVWLQLEHAAREGARVASLRNPDSYTTTRIRSAAPGLSIDSISITPSSPDNDDAGSPVRVALEADAPVFTPIMRPLFGGGTVRLRAAAELMVE